MDCNLTGKKTVEYLNNTKVPNRLKQSNAYSHSIVAGGFDEMS